MTEELIKDRHSSSYTSQAPLNLEHPYEIKAHSLAISNPYANTIASCKDFPLTIHAGKALFLEQEQELISLPLQEQQQKQKESFLKRLSLVNIKKQMAVFFAKVKDSIGTWKDKIRTTLGWSQSDKIITNNTPKKESFLKSRSYQAEKMPEVVPAPTPSSTIDRDKKRIEEIEDTMAVYQAELLKAGGNVKAMMEIACKMSILVGSLGYRFTKQEIKDYMDHLEVNIKKRVDTYKNGHMWAWLSVGILFTSSAFSFAAIPGSFMGNRLGKILTGLGSTATPFSQFGQGASKLDEMSNEKNQALRTQYDHDGEKLKQTRTDFDRTNEKTQQQMKEMLESIREAERARNQAAQRSIA